MLKKGEGIIIRTTDYGESNKILTVYTKEFGKIGMMARGAKKPNSRLSSVSQLFTYGSFLYHSSRGLGTLSQGEAIHSFRAIREDLFKTAYAAYTVELIDKLTEENVPNPSLFKLLYHTLYYINENYDMEVVTFIFETKMLAVAGIAPYLDGCVNCKREEGPFAFSVREGGFLCQRCFYLDDNRIPLTEASQKLLRLFLHFNLKRLGTISLKEKTKQEIKLILDKYYEAYSGLYIKSKRFLEQLDKL
ncbi:DNA repair protein RecO [Pueribacillus theae]|uniref:DNA repair protein RecO n=1 Tax=Pueribacillus theae TaxID=2171751 RepID=A0A2U1K4Z6_9BACI|nr:DNA repair protein RecO [Pueribacillus theae]PWA12462.1 DNA repair protein RecO [Pueribacillus theae]